MPRLCFLRLAHGAIRAAVAAVLTSACGVPEYVVNTTSAIGGAGGTAGGSPSAGSNNGGGAFVGGSTGAGGQSVSRCNTNSDCSSFAATKVCDNSISPGRCVECLPGVTDCGSGLYCGADKQCHVGCSSNIDCDSPACDASVCPTLNCDINTHLCQGCALDSNCPAGTKCNLKTATCSPSCSSSNTCPTGWVCCAGSCANIKTDAANCASCGTSCAQPNANVQCLNGTCRIESCAEGYSDCNGTYNDGCETDLLSDGANCKTCGTACTGLLMCREGSCAEPSCTDGYADCDKNATNSCETNTKRDILNCGSCGNNCSTINGKASCLGGVCSMSCNSGWGDCNQNGNDGCETDLTTTADHCGTCKVACTNGHGSTACVASKCTPNCGSGFANCNSDPIDGCETSLTTDVNNCGDCDHSCTLDHATSACNSGKCAVASCQANYGDCNASATDGCETPLLTSPTNCGKCGNACSNSNGKGSCVSGQCTILCDANFGDCDNDVSNGCETDLTKSVKNCGTCGKVCADTTEYSATCAAGTCGVSSCTKPAAECDNNTATTCETNLNTDVNNCGSCGHVCAFANATATCSNGVCIIGSCNPGFGNCNSDTTDGCETNTNQEVANCGKCGTPCTLGHAAATCSGGACTVSSCEKDYVDCNGIAADGCESHISDDAKNCGACNNVCSLEHATAACSAGTCIVASCEIGYENCNAIATDGCEINLTNDPAHCGGCTNVCNTNNGAATCAAGLCGIVCSPNFDNCDNDSNTNGCETDLTSATANCGQCGTVCSNGHGTTKCVSGTCTPACATGYLSCDNNVVNGCEQDIYTSTSHCGGCTSVCGTYANAASQCTSGACGMGKCVDGFGDCNTSATDGCETPTSSDVNNCGSCKVVCSNVNGAPGCASGVCSIACNAGYKDCSSSSPGCETDVQTSVSNCGNCGNACSGTNPACTAGKCLLDIVARKDNAITATGMGSTTPNIQHSLSLGVSNKRLVVLTVAGRGDSLNSQMEDPKYDGKPMTRKATLALASGNVSVGIYYLLDADLPTTAGSYPVTFTSYSQNWGIAATVIEFDNVDQTTPFVTTAQNTQSCATQPSVSAAVPLAGDYSLEVVGVYLGSSTTATPKNGQTVVGSVGFPANSNVMGVTGLLGPYATTTTQTLGWTIGACNNTGQIALVLGRASS